MQVMAIIFSRSSLKCTNSEYPSPQFIQVGEVSSSIPYPGETGGWRVVDADWVASAAEVGGLGGGGWWRGRRRLGGRLGGRGGGLGGGGGLGKLSRTTLPDRMPSWRRFVGETSPLRLLSPIQLRINVGGDFRFMFRLTRSVSVLRDTPRDFHLLGPSISSSIAPAGWVVPIRSLLEITSRNRHRPERFPSAAGDEQGRRRASNKHRDRLP